MESVLLDRTAQETLDCELAPYRTWLGTLRVLKGTQDRRYIHTRTCLYRGARHQDDVDDVFQTKSKNYRKQLKAGLRLYQRFLDDPSIATRRS